MVMTSIVVVNWNTRHLIAPCVEAIKRYTDYPFELILVDNGSTDDSLKVMESYQGDNNIKIVVLPENLGYAGGNNAGIREAKGEVLCLLNSDAFVCGNWLGPMLRCIGRSGVGLVGPWTNRAKGRQRRKLFLGRFPPVLRSNEEVSFLSFFCVLIHRRVVEQIGLLDERFNLGTYEDDDYCRRARKAGFKLMIEGRSWVWHQAHATFAANRIDPGRQQTKNTLLFQAKWASNCDSTGGGISSPPEGSAYFLQDRREMLGLVPQECRKLLEVGCGAGIFGKMVMDRQGAEVWGIELVPEMAEVARTHLHRVITGDVVTVLREISGERFDCIVCNDILEHLVDPDAFLVSCHSILEPGGCIVASIPNLRFYKVMRELLLKKDFRYRGKGVLDRTHLRFFTKKSVERLFEESGYRLESLYGINSTGSSRFRMLNFFLGNLVADMRYAQFACRARPM